MTKRTPSSQRWLKEHFSDPYVKQAQLAGYRSRAVFKLLELQERDKLFKPGMTVVDLGAAPGGWSQVIAGWVHAKVDRANHPHAGCVIALDILPMAPITGVEFIQGDFSSDAVLHALIAKLPSRVDWVISDIAPNLSGHPGIDMPRVMGLVELVLDFALHHLVLGGGLLIKVFQGEGFDALLKMMRAHFTNVAVRKPKASRDRSREIYILARGLKDSQHGCLK